MSGEYGLTNLGSRTDLGRVVRKSDRGFSGFRVCPSQCTELDHAPLALLRNGKRLQMVEEGEKEDDPFVLHRVLL